MRKEYYRKKTTGENELKLAKALSMIEDAPVEQVAKVTGMPKTITIKAAKETGRGHLLDRDTLNLIAPPVYEDMVPDPEPEETREQRIIRLNTAVENFQKSCQHDKYHVRCSRCFKILGSELNFEKTHEENTTETEITTQEV